MNTCVLIFGAWFLSLNDGYGDFNYAGVDDIETIHANDRFPRIYMTNDSILTGWLPDQERYMTSTETLELMGSCGIF